MIYLKLNINLYGLIFEMKYVIWPIFLVIVTSNYIGDTIGSYVKDKD